MRLRTQVVLWLCVVAVLVYGLLFWGAGPRLRQAFLDIEEVDVRRNVERARNALTTELSALESTAHDWAAWDETADYVQGRHPAYVTENLGEDTLTNLRLTLMAFYDRSGHVIRAEGFDLEEETVGMPSGAVLAAVARFVPTDRAPDDTTSSSGLAALGGQLALVAVHPILSNGHEPPAVGTLVLGRTLTAGEVDRLATQVRLPLTLRAFDDPNNDPNVIRALPGDDANGSGVVIVPQSAETAAGYTLLEGLHGEPIAVLEAEIPRDAYSVGRSTAGYSMAAILGAFVVLAGSFLLFLDRRVLAPTSHLTRDVSEIERNQNPSARVTVRGRNEVATLGHHINGMLTAIEESRAALELSEKRYHNLFESSRDPIYITAEDGRFIDANQALVDLFGYTKAEIMTMRAGDLYERPEDREAFRAAIQERGFVASYPVTLLKKNGEVARCLLTTSHETLAGTNETVYQGIIRDVTELLRQQEKLTYLATHDPLTGLLTRDALDDRLNLEIARAIRNLDRLAVFYLDLDRFKEVNDLHGHAAGDRVLQEVATRLRDALRASDSVARLGGDEFVALLPGIDSPQDAEIAANKILTELREAFRRAEQACGLSVSIGIALFPDDADDAVHLLQRADRAMYCAKNQGRDAWKRYDRQVNGPSHS